MSIDEKAHQTRVIQACMTAIGKVRSAGWDPAYFKLRAEDARFGAGYFGTIGGVPVDIASGPSHLVGLGGFETSELYGVWRFPIWSSPPSLKWVQGPQIVVCRPGLPRRAIELLAAMRSDRFYLPAGERDLEMCRLLTSSGLAIEVVRSGSYTFDITQIGIAMRDTWATLQKIKGATN